MMMDLLNERRRRSRRGRTTRWLLLLLLFALLLVGDIQDVKAQTTTTTTTTTTSSSQQQQQQQQQSTTLQQLRCGPPGLPLRIAGSSIVQPVAEVWQQEYQRRCPNSNVTVEGNGDSAEGAARVCHIVVGKEPVDIGMMSRDWYLSEGTTAISRNVAAEEEEEQQQQQLSDNNNDGFTYRCTYSDRSAIQLDVAVDAVVMVVQRNGRAARCLRQQQQGDGSGGGGGSSNSGGALNGLTTSQLRWIFSNLTVQQLEDRGWDRSSVPYLNFPQENTAHYWNALHPRCPGIPLRIAGMSPESNMFEFVQSRIFDDEDETIDNTQRRQPQGGYYSSTNSGDIVQYLNQYDEAIAFMGFTYYYTQARTELEAIAIYNDEFKAFVEPTPDTIAQEGSYIPLARRVYMNLWKDPQSLEKTRPFLEMAYSSEVSHQLEEQQTSLMAIPEWERILMLSRIGARGGMDLSATAQLYCASLVGVAGGSAFTRIITVAGSSTVFPVAQVWAGMYTAACGGPSRFPMQVEGGGSTIGASRVCAHTTSGIGPAVDIGTTSRPFQHQEATSENGWNYTCVSDDDDKVMNSVEDDIPRSVIQLDVAIDGLSLVVKRGGRAHACLQRLHGGSAGSGGAGEGDGRLTVDQIRWIFTSYSDEELEQSGTWDSSSVPFRNVAPPVNAPEKYWSELNNTCVQTPILIAGPDLYSGTYDYFHTQFLPNRDDPTNPETLDFNRQGGYYNSAVDENIVQYLLQHDDAIGYVGFSYYFRNRDRIVATAIQSPNDNDDLSFVAPDHETVDDGTYPLSRRIYMNVWDHAPLLNRVRPFFDFCYSSSGSAVMEAATGYSAIPSWERFIMLTRIGASTGVGSLLLLDDEDYCGVNNGQIKIAGSSTVFPVAKVWAGVYDLYCNVKLDVEGGGSSIGAARVCNTHLQDDAYAVDIGDMSRAWKASEARMVDDEDLPFLYDCVESRRSVIQVPVAIDGLSVTAQLGGRASGCIHSMGGLTLDQLRWIFSSFTKQQLLATGWDPASVPHEDKDDDTHLWSELSEFCSPNEIRIAGADVLSGTYEYFMEAILTSHEEGETFDSNRPHSYVNSDRDEILVNYLQDFDVAVAYFGYAYYFANADTLYASPIRNPESLLFVTPNETTVGNGDYAPLSRSIYMNLWNEKSSLKRTVPFMEFGFSQGGDRLVSQIGYVVVPEERQRSALEVLRRLAPSSHKNTVVWDARLIAIVSVAGGIIAMVLVGSIYWIIRHECFYCLAPKLGPQDGAFPAMDDFQAHVANQENRSAGKAASGTAVISEEGEYEDEEEDSNDGRMA